MFWDLGLLDRVFSNADLSTLSGQLAVVMCAGTAGKSWEASQPHLSTINSVIIALAHNSALVNTDELRRQLIELGVPFPLQPVSGSRPNSYFAAQRTGHLREGIPEPWSSCAAATPWCSSTSRRRSTHSAIRGIRPLVLGKLVDEGLNRRQCRIGFAAAVAGQRRDSRRHHPCHSAGSWVVASETCALDIVGASTVRRPSR